MKAKTILFLLSAILVIGLVSSYVVQKVNANSNQIVENITNAVDKDTLLNTSKNSKETEGSVELNVPKEYPQNYFRNPLDGEIRLSGTFGELRSNHFHAGLDMRTGGVQGKPIYAAADGYVSRIKVSTYGYGKALYIRHPNGYTTVYGHLQKYNGAIAQLVEDAQYRQQKFDVHLFPKSGELKVKKGDVVAYSGNSGGSGGPHLHFEIRNTATEATINPLLFGLNIKDNHKPKIRKVYLHHLIDWHRKEQGLFDYQLFDEKNPINGKTVSLHPGSYGIAAELKDEFLATTERLGVNYMKLYVDEVEVFDTKIESFHFHETRYMNSHMDFANHKRNNIKATKLWKDDGNKLPFYKHIDKGRITVKEGEYRKVKIWIKDFQGLEKEVNFTLFGTPQEVESAIEINEHAMLCSPAKQNHLTGNEYSCIIPANSLYFDYKVPIEVGSKTGFSKKITFGKYHVPMHKKMTCKIKADIPKGMESQVYVVELFKGKKYPVSAFYTKGFAKFTTKDFGTYYVDVDTVKPKIKVLSTSLNSGVKFYVSDALGSGIKKFKATLDGEWFLLDWDNKTGILKGKPRGKLTSGTHKLRLEVTDDCWNKAIFEKTITTP